MSSFINCFVVFHSLIFILIGNCEGVKEEPVLQRPSPDTSAIPNAKSEEKEKESENANEINRIRPPYFSSPIYLTHLAQTEQLVYELLGNYEQELRERLEILQNYRVDYEDGVLEALRQAGKLDDPDRWSRASIISSNPLLAYRMIRRLSKDLNSFTNHLWKSLENQLWEGIEASKGNFEWPSEVDLAAATKTLIRLQDTYDFNIDQFAEGAIPNYPLKVGISAQQSLEISKTALSLEEITGATEWFQAAYIRAVSGDLKGQPQTIPMDDLTQEWDKIYKSFQKIWPMSIFKTHDIFAEAKSLLREEFDVLKSSRTFDHRYINFKALCRGDQILPEKEKSTLFCFRDRTFHPYLFLNPLKIEVHNWDPLIYQIYDLIGAKSIEEISLSSIQAMASLVESGVAQFQAKNDLKTYTYGWLFEENSGALQLLSGKLRNYVGFGDSDGSDYIVSSYAVGNHYEPCTNCFDYSQVESEANKTVTKASAHIVLHEPELGGELAFTLTGTLVKPVLGSLIVYNDLNPKTNENDENVLHGSCPVLIGQKWMLTKLFYVS